MQPIDKWRLIWPTLTIWLWQRLLKEGGGTKNADLAERYDIKEEFYAPARQRPSLILLVKDRVNNNVIEAFKYEEDEEWEVNSITTLSNEKVIRLQSPFRAV